MPNYGNTETVMRSVDNIIIMPLYGNVLYKSDCMQILVSCTKGILNETLETPHEILSRILSPATCKNLAYLSGPSFAAEVAAGQPTVVTIASHNDEAASKVQMLLSNPRFRCYRTTDVEGNHTHTQPTQSVFKAHEACSSRT